MTDTPQTIISVPVRGAAEANKWVEPKVTGEGPFLLVTLSDYEGLLLRRYETFAEANTAAVSYHGPTHWLFEAGKQLDLAYT
jgi:hypothetical protein